MATILVVDDSRFSRSRVVAAIAPLGHRIVEADNGNAALAAIDAAAPDLVITDLLMPELDGFGLLQALRDRGVHSPAIVVSADIQTTSQEQARRLGAVEFLNKPFSPEMLKHAVEQLLPSVLEVSA